MKKYKIWTQIEEIDEEEDEYEILCGSTRGVFEEFKTLEEGKAYQETILGE